MEGSSESLGLWLCTTARVYEQALSRELAPLGLTAQYFQVLVLLHPERGTSQAEITERLQMEPAPLAALLKRMERDGWIHRREDRGDRRKKIVEAMPKAQRVRERIRAVAEKLDAVAFTRLDRAEAAHVHQALTAVQENLGERG